MKLNNKTCLVCGNKYSYCPNCAEYKNKPRWMMMFDTENCKNVFEGICDYTLRHNISKAKDALSSCDLSVVEKMDEKNRNFVKKIMNYNPIQEQLNLAEEVEAKTDNFSVEEIKNSQPIVEEEIDTSDNTIDEDNSIQEDSDSLKTISTNQQLVFKRSKKKR